MFNSDFKNMCIASMLEGGHFLTIRWLKGCKSQRKSPISAGFAYVRNSNIWQPIQYHFSWKNEIDGITNTYTTLPYLFDKVLQLRLLISRAMNFRGLERILIFLFMTCEMRYCDFWNLNPHSCISNTKWGTIDEIAITRITSIDLAHIWTGV